RDPAAQLGLDRLDLRRHPGVADAVPEVTDDAPDRAVDLVRILSLQPCRRHRLGVLPRLPRLRIAHGLMLPRPTSCLRPNPTSLPSEVVTGELSRLRSLMMPRSSATGTNGRYVLGRGRMACSTSCSRSPSSSAALSSPRATRPPRFQPPPAGRGRPAHR